MKLFLLSLQWMIAAVYCHAQSLSINTDGGVADTSAMLDVRSTVKGVLIPRMTKAQKNAIALPAQGLQVYQTGPDSAGLYYYDGGWRWISDNTKTDSAYWKMTGNSNITGPSAFALSPIDGHFIGTTDARDFVIGVNNMERLRFRANNSFVGFGSPDPQYALDLTLNFDAVNNCSSRNGIRFKPATAITAGCDVGYFMGFPNAVSPASPGNDIMFWNFDGNEIEQSNSFRWGFGTDTAAGLGLKLHGYRLGIAKTSPVFALDILTNPDATAPCGMNGIHMTHPLQDRGCQSGIFFGFNPMDSPDGATIWNYGDFGSSQNFLRFGVDDETGEVMRLKNHSVGINVTSPQAVLHIRDIAAIRNGLRITHPVNATSGSLYFGANLAGDEMEISTEFDNPIRFYTNISSQGVPRMSIHEGGDVNIGTSMGAPGSTLRVEGTIAVGVSTGVAGGATPVSLANLGAYISLDPSPGADQYQLPAAASCAGRIYYIRNNSATDPATLGSAGGNLCPGNNNLCNATYQLPANSSGKTVMAISDGANWVVGQIN